MAVRNRPAMLYSLAFWAAKLPMTYGRRSRSLMFALGRCPAFSTWQVGLAVLTIALLPVVAYLSSGTRRTVRRHRPGRLAASCDRRYWAAGSDSVW